nr:hypothetical protein [Acidobacteriota bacterium]
MLIKNNQSFSKIRSIILSATILIFISALEIWAQIRSVPPPPPPVQGEDFTWWYVSLFVLVLGLGGAIFWWLNNKKGQKGEISKVNQAAGNETELKSVDADKEFEWLRKNQKLVGKMSNQNLTAKQYSNSLPNGNTATGQNEAAQENLRLGVNDKN